MERFELDAQALRPAPPGRGLSLLLRNAIVAEPDALDDAAARDMVAAVLKMTREQKLEWFAAVHKMVFFRGRGPLQESNASLVEWEDGSLGLFVGDRLFDLATKPSCDSLVFLRRDDLLVSHFAPQLAAVVHAAPHHDQPPEPPQ